MYPSSSYYYPYPQPYPSRHENYYGKSAQPYRQEVPYQPPRTPQRVLYQCPCCQRYGVEEPQTSEDERYCTRRPVVQSGKHFGTQTEVPIRNKELERHFQQGGEDNQIPSRPWLPEVDARPCQQGSDLNDIIEAFPKETRNQDEIKRAVKFVDRCCKQLLDSPCLSFEESEDEMEGWGNHDGKKYWDSKDRDDDFAPCGPCAPCAPRAKSQENVKKQLEHITRELNKLIDGLQKDRVKKASCCCIGGSRRKNLAHRCRHSSSSSSSESFD